VLSLIPAYIRRNYTKGVRYVQKKKEPHILRRSLIFLSKKKRKRKRKA
jgi:hypothetical protein